MSIYKIARKNESPHVQGWHQAVCKKWKRIGDFDTNNKNIQPGYKNGVWYRKMCHAYKEKWENTNNRRNRTVKERIRMLGEKEN